MHCVLTRPLPNPPNRTPPHSTPSQAVQVVKVVVQTLAWDLVAHFMGRKQRHAEAKMRKELALVGPGDPTGRGHGFCFTVGCFFLIFVCAMGSSWLLLSLWSYG